MSMFTQRHYIAVADTIGLTLRQIDQAEVTADKINGEYLSDVHHRFSSATAIHRLIDNFEVTFSEDNSQFSREKFSMRIGTIRREGLGQTPVGSIPTPEEMDRL